MITHFRRGPKISKKGPNFEQKGDPILSNKVTKRGPDFEQKGDQKGSEVKCADKCEQRKRDCLLHASLRLTSSPPTSRLISLPQFSSLKKGKGQVGNCMLENKEPALDAWTAHYPPYYYWASSTSAAVLHTLAN